MSASTALLQAALARWFSELTHEGLFATDANLCVIVWNRWMEIHTRRPAADVIGRPLFQLFPELVSRGIDARYQDALREAASARSRTDCTAISSPSLQRTRTSG